MSNSGFLLIDKQSGPTSHDVVDVLRRLTGIRKIGHAGTLDPLASGLMILAIGREATKRINQFVKLDKEYIADIRLGAETDTYDCQGQIVQKYDVSEISEKVVKQALQKFKGQQEQLPPMYSAKKIKGKRLYEYARRGEDIERQPSQIEIYKIKLLSYNWPDLQIKVQVSSGTYIRSLAFDLGRELNCGGYLQALKRTKIGIFDLKQAVNLNQLNHENWNNFLMAELLI